MSEGRRDKDYLSDIFEAITRIKEYTRDYDYDRLFSDKKTQDAIVRNLEVIGEATKNISRSLKDKHPQIPWRDLSGLRDKLIHHYFGIDYDIVWNIVEKELSKLHKKIEKVISETE